ncbi:MAG: carboxypeptidase regulatory-like domain-containing protein [Bryobacteraceae bacterium]
MLASAIGFGQSTYGSIVGVVTDATGAVVVGGAVSVANTETNIVKTAHTSANGSYEVTHLLPGTYRVRAEHQGFKATVRDGIVVESRAVVRIDVQLEVGSTSVEVQVSASTPVIETETAQIADTRSARQLRDLPILSNESTFAYLLTMPGAQSVSINTYAFNGARAAQTDTMIDGIAAPRSSTPLTGTHNTTEMVAEVRVHGSNNSAEFQAPGVVSIVTRSGTNQLRGSAYYQHNNSALDARDFFTAKKPSSKTHTANAVVGGPVFIPKLYNGRDRTFFMISLFGQRVPGATPLNATVPTPAMRQGDFSAFAAITDPATGIPFPGNAIPASRFSPVSLRVQERFYPLPNSGDPGVLTTNNHRTQMLGRNIANRWEARLDQKLSNQNMLYARYSWRGAVQEPNENLPTIPVRNGYRRGPTFVLSDTHSFGTSLINEFRFGRQSSPNQVLAALSGIEVLRYTGIQGLTPPGDYRGMPAFTFSGGGQVTAAQSTNHTVDRYHSWTLADNLTWIRGRHTFKGGVDLVHNGTEGVNMSSSTFGTFAFNGFFSGNSYADFLLGLPERATRATYREYQDIGGKSWYYFFEDAWRASSKITLTLGARYEYQSPVTDSEGLMYNLDPRTMALVVPDPALNSGKINPRLPGISIVKASEAGYPQSLRAVDKNNVVPRIGLAIRPLPKTVIRAGYGMFIDDFGFSVAGPSAGPLYAYSEIFQNTNRRAPQYVFPNPFGESGSSGTITANGFNVALRNPYSQQWNLTLEREFGDVGVRLSYIGTKGTSLVYTKEVNVPLPSTTPFSSSRRPYRQYGVLLFSENGGNSIYHALQTEVERRFGRALYFQAAWTWSNLISDVGDARSDLGPTLENPFDRRRDRGREPYAVRHRVNGSVIWELPFGAGRRHRLPAVLNQIAGGWTVSSMFFMETGRYVNATMSGRDLAGIGTTSGLRPDCIANPNLPPSERRINRWFNPDAFVMPPANIGRFGNCGVNTIEGPGLNTQHLNFTKRLVRVNEHTHLDFQLSMLNVLNHPNFNPPQANISAPSTVAQIQATRRFGEMGSQAAQDAGTAGRFLAARLRLMF